MSFLHTKQAEVRLVCTVLESAVNTTLIGSANLNQAYRKENLEDNQVRLQDFTSGIHITGKSTVDGDTGTFELWGYPVKGGAAQFLGEYTFTTDKAVDDDGLFYIDEFVVTSNAAQHDTGINNMPDGVATIQFDGLGLAYIVGLVTAITSSASPGSVKIELRPW